MLRKTKRGFAKNIIFQQRLATAGFDKQLHFDAESDGIFALKKH
jgi:hypothetical protein